MGAGVISDENIKENTKRKYSLKKITKNTGDPLRRGLSKTGGKQLSFRFPASQPALQIGWADPRKKG
jgi:hypothetical protein